MLISVEQRVAATPAHWSARTREVAAMFGLPGRADLDIDADASGSSRRAAMTTIVPRIELDVPLPGPGVMLIIGPSGSGKSTLLSLVAAASAARGAEIVRVPRGDGDGGNGNAGHDDATMSEGEQRAVIDLVAETGTLSEALELLSLAGLGDAFILLRRPQELSDGQRSRLHLAQAMAAARSSACDGQPALIVIDEFAATLDRITATNLARNIRRWSDRSGAAFALATTHDDLIEPLAPDVLIRKELGEGIAIERRPPRRTRGDQSALSEEAPSPSADDEFMIEPGTLDDYRALASFHYRSHYPGAATSVLRVLALATPPVKVQPMLAGVLVRSLPLLNGAARDAALGGRYAGLTPRERGFALNREMRCISRVIIDPRFRGRGLAVRLVRFALEHPENEHLRYTEALAAMGRVSPFFERAGMRRYDLPESCRPARARFRDALDAAGLSAEDLTQARALDRCEPIVRSMLLGESRRFLRATRRMSRVKLDALPEGEILAAAATRLLLQPVYYLFAHRRDHHANHDHATAC